MSIPYGVLVPSKLLHVVAAVLGVAVLAYEALPVAYDGVLNTDTAAIIFLAVSGTVLALVGGLVEGLALRAGYKTLAVACLFAFALVAVAPPALESGRWFASELEPQSSENFGLALVAWVLTVTLEYFVARAIGGTGASGDDAGAS